jgi:2-polyprenyl-3-methyl-5-hydroxy-6-metoxy-1,4-benzoquinol methylase
MTGPWGKILVSTRLEKQVTAQFFQVWERIIQRGLQPGDGALSVRGKVAHKAQNDVVRYFLKTDCDTLLTLDSDADVPPEFIQQFREYQPGWDYDILQAFYTRRGWPPRAIWMRRNALGQMTEYFVTDPDKIEDVDLAGTHACLFRREVFERMLGDNDPSTFEWFYYPRHSEESEDGAFSKEAKAAGFRIGATSAIRAGHICEIVTNWGSYQEYLTFSGRRALNERYSQMAQMIAEFTDESPDVVMAKSLRGSANVRDAWTEFEPGTAAEEREFYGWQDNGYLYDLLSWNCLPSYQRIIDPLSTVTGLRVLIIGTGLGTEADILADRNDVTCFDVPGVLRDFAQWRLGERVEWLNADRLTPSTIGRNDYDLIVAIDTIEHVHPQELPDFLNAISKGLRTGGSLYAHNNFGQQDTYPMHHDNSAAFADWCEYADMEQLGPMQWRKRSGLLASIETEKCCTQSAVPSPLTR